MNNVAATASNHGTLVKTYLQRTWLRTAFESTSSCHSAAMTAMKTTATGLILSPLHLPQTFPILLHVKAIKEAHKFARQLFWGGPGALVCLKALQVIVMCSQGCESLMCSHSGYLRFACLQCALQWHPLLLLPEGSFCIAYRIKGRLTSKHSVKDSTGSALKYLTSCLSPTLCQQALPSVRFPHAQLSLQASARTHLLLWNGLHCLSARRMHLLSEPSPDILTPLLSQCFQSTSVMGFMFCLSNFAFWLITLTCHFRAYVSHHHYTLFGARTMSHFPLFPQT